LAIKKSNKNKHTFNRCQNIKDLYFFYRMDCWPCSTVKVAFFCFCHSSHQYIIFYASSSGMDDL